MIKKKCLECSKSFIPDPSNLRKGGGKFCSMKCYHKQATSHKRGKESPYWKGSEAGYEAIHDWIKSMFGRATKCQNPNCVYPKKSRNGVLVAPKAFDWALRKDRKYEDRRPDSFIQLCRSCHKKYDYEESKHKRRKGTFI